MTERKQSGEFTPGFGSGKYGCNFFQNAKPSPDSVVSSLTTGTSVAVFGLRRIGKTSLLAETRERLRSMGKYVIWVNLDTNDTLSKALNVILSSMQQEGNKGIITGIKDWMENSEMIPTEIKATIGAMISGKIDNSFENFDVKFIDVLFQQIGRLLEAQESDNKPIIIFDELTTLIKNTIDNDKSADTRMIVGRLNSFLGQLRYWRTDEVGIKMAVSGSVSFNWLKREYGVRSDSINDCVPIYIKEMDREDARKLIELCVNASPPLNWNDQLTEDLLDFLPAYFPGVIQLAFRVVSSKSNPVSILDDSIQDEISEVLWNQYFEQFDARFNRYGISERNRIGRLFDVLEKKEGWKIEGKEALKILDEVSLAENEPDGREVINHLRSDSFIKMVTGGLRFSSGLVPAWRNFQS